MKRFPDREELVAAYWRKLTSAIESDEVPPHAKTPAMNGRLRSRPRLECSSALPLYGGENACLRYAARSGSMHSFIRIPELLCGLSV